MIEKPQKVTSTLRLTFEEMMYVSAVLEMVLGGSVKENTRSKMLRAIFAKIVSCLEQATRDGLFDPTKIKV